jgi:hypothetical protein
MLLIIIWIDMLYLYCVNIFKPKFSSFKSNLSIDSNILVRLILSSIAYWIWINLFLIKSYVFLKGNFSNKIINQFFPSVDILIKIIKKRIFDVLWFTLNTIFIERFFLYRYQEYQNTKKIHLSLIKFKSHPKSPNWKFY